MTARHVLGFLILAALFGGFTWFMARESGWAIVVAVWLLTLGTIAVVYLGMSLVTS